MLESQSQEIKTALDAQRDAQALALAPFAFQAAKSARDLGVLSALDKAADGLPREAVAQQCRLTPYAAQVLLEACLAAGLVLSNDDGVFRLSKTGWFLLHDDMARVNMDFTQDVCYQGLFHLQDSLTATRPEGLKTLGPWPTLYQGLMQLPEGILRSWLAFDHHYSDSAFDEALIPVLRQNPKSLVDVGGNTGKFSLRALGASPDLKVTLVDLPAQCRAAETHVAAQGLASRFQAVPLDVLDVTSELPKGRDAIWMSQFLDCFSEAQVLALLGKAKAAMHAQTSFWILEPCWDHQRWESAAICLQYLSLYFTTMANGNSKMFKASDLERMLAQTGLSVVAVHRELGLGHTLWECRREK